MAGSVYKIIEIVGVEYKILGRGSKDSVRNCFKIT